MAAKLGKLIIRNGGTAEGFFCASVIKNERKTGCSRQQQRPTEREDRRGTQEKGEGGGIKRFNS